MKAIILQVNEALETNIALVYKSVFLGETAAILTGMGLEVSVYDATIEGYCLNDLVKAFCEEPQLVIFVADVQQSRITKRVAEYCKLCSPKSKILVIGRATSFIPQFFLRYPFDAVHVRGDREAAIISYVEYLNGVISLGDISNIAVLENNTIVNTKRTVWLEPKFWKTPDLSKLNIEAYERLNQKQHPNRSLILGVTATKGCSYGCRYCGASLEEGKQVRYGIAKSIIEWGNSINLDCTVQLWSPNILESIEWLQGFVETYEKDESTFSWRGVARLASINEEKIAVINQHNCKEIAIGLEMIKRKTNNSLKGTGKQFTDAVDLFRKYSINLKCLLMLGYPGYEIDDIVHTIKLLNENGLKYRITGYTPLHDLMRLSVEELDQLMIENYDRRLFYYNNQSNIDSKLFYEMLSTNGEVLL